MPYSPDIKIRVALFLIFGLLVNVKIFSQCTSTYNTINAAVCNNQLPFQFGGMNINGPGTYMDTLVNAAGCDSVITLNLVVNSATTSSTSVSLCSSELPYIWNGQSYNNAGVYSITLTSSSGCDSVSILLLFVNNPGQWTGMAGTTAWEDSLNWGCNLIPGPATPVVINYGTVILHANTTIYSLTLGPDANFTVDPGVQLTILH